MVYKIFFLEKVKIIYFYKKSIAKYKPWMYNYNISFSVEIFKKILFKFILNII